ncbi:MAG TPA: hypothetical protein VMU47_14825 [Caldimonas sp.]|nr:hypothetical protein [Caldimonas sp.]
MFISAPQDSDGATAIYESSAASHGFVMNLTRAWAWRPDVFDGFAALRGQLTNDSTLSKRELAVMVCAAASELGDSYCCLAWGKTLAQQAGPDAAAAVIANTPAAGLTDRESALAIWARKVVSNPNATTATDVSALREAGLSEREIVEATTFVAFRLAFSTVNDALGVHPDGKLAAQVPSQVRAAARFGRAPTEA